MKKILENLLSCQGKVIEKTWKIFLRRRKPRVGNGYPELKFTLNFCPLKVMEYELALTQRDDVLKQLSDSLQTEKQNRNSIEEAYSTQTQQLTQQIHLLQGQMQQVGERLVFIMVRLFVPWIMGTLHVYKLF
jgi:hypothetical protein